MMIRETDFKDLFIVEHKYNSDSRGDFFEIFRLAVARSKASMAKMVSSAFED